MVIYLMHALVMQWWISVYKRTHILSILLEIKYTGEQIMQKLK